MFFLLTNFIHPIEKPIPLSAYFQFFFDNPRSKEEIKIVKDLIKKSWTLSQTIDGYQYQRFPMKKEVPNQDVVTFEMLIKEFLEKHFGKEEAESQIKKIEGSKEKIIDFYARNWVIVRYGTKEMVKEDKNLQEEHKKMLKENKTGVFLLEDDHIFEKREKQLDDYSHIIALLSGSNDYYGWNFLIINSLELQFFSPNIPIMRNILEQALAVKSANRNPSECQVNFELFIKAIERPIKLLDERLIKKDINEDFLLYIGNVLKSAKPSNNEFSSLVRLVSIIEMLLTHQPDFSRFNVEDSISKQFVLKTIILMKEANPKINLEETKTKLKEIYNQRSNIVHGNFESVNKFIASLKKNERYFSDLISDSYMFARTVLIYYIQQPKFTKFLKEN